MSRRRVMAVFAHPDDESVFAGGTLAALAASGAEVSLLCLTRGARGPDRAAGGESRLLPARRMEELHAAASILGVRQVVCLDFPDGMLPWTDAALVEDAIRQHLRAHEPDLVMTFSPEGGYWHPDHRATYARTLAVLASERQQGRSSPPCCGLTMPDDLMPGLVAAMAARRLPADLWGLDPAAFGVPSATITLTLDVSPFWQQKVQAIRAHASQIDAAHLFGATPPDIAARFLGGEYAVDLNGDACSLLAGLVDTVNVTGSPVHA